MADDETERELLSSLAENSHIKAAILFDRHGNVKRQVGSSRVVGTTDRFTNGSVENGQDLPKENVYLVAVGSHYLLTVFADSVEFETVKTDVNSMLAEFSFNVE